MRYTNINGKIVPTETAVIPADNGAFRYGIGLFETMLVKKGEIRLARYHWERLWKGMAQLAFEVPPLMTAAMMEEEVIRTVKKNSLMHHCRVRLQVYAGGGGVLGGSDRKPYYVIECYAMEEGATTINENGLIVGIAEGGSKSADSISNLKTSNALVYAMAARQAKANKWNDALVCNTNGAIIESAIANVFWVKDGAVYTPPLASGCVAGVMRRHILEQIKGVTEKILTRDELMSADEVFLTNAIKTIRWVGRIGDKQYRNSKAIELFNTLF